MQRIQVYLEDDTAKAITKFASKNNLSMSNAAADVLKNHFQKDAQKTSAVDPETKAYFMRIINTLNQVLMCVYDEDKTSVKAKSVEACIQKITSSLSRTSKLK